MNDNEGVQLEVEEASCKESATSDATHAMCLKIFLDILPNIIPDENKKIPVSIYFFVQLSVQLLLKTMYYNKLHFFTFFTQMIERLIRPIKRHIFSNMGCSVCAADCMKYVISKIS